MKTTISYIFGIVIASSYIYMAFISRTMQPDRYKYRIVASIVSLVFGLIVDYLQIFQTPKGLLILFGIMPFIYLFYYEILRRLMRSLIGKYPYAPHWEKIGERISGHGYPRDRFVTGNDHLFKGLLFFLPIITLAIISVALTN